MATPPVEISIVGIEPDGKVRQAHFPLELARTIVDPQQGEKCAISCQSLRIKRKALMCADAHLAVCGTSIGVSTARRGLARDLE
jgi:hypothetical protein